MEALSQVAQALFRIIDPAAMAMLPWYIGIPGLMMLILSAWRAITSLLRLKLITAFTSAVGAIVIAVMMSNLGKISAAYTMVPS